MTVLKLSNKWANVLVPQPETGMGYQIASIYLKDGRRFDRVTIVGGTIADIDKDRAIPFTESEIERIVVTHGR